MNEAAPDTPEFDNRAVVIARAVPEDAEAIMTIKRDAWLQSYTNVERGITKDGLSKQFGDIQVGIQNWQEGIASETDSSNKATFVARLGDKVVGYTSPCVMEGQKRLGALYVAPSAQGLGVGGELLAQAVNWHGRDQDIFLHVLTYNVNAIRFYERHGFEKTDRPMPDEFDEQGIKLLEEIEMKLSAQTTIN